MPHDRLHPARGRDVPERRPFTADDVVYTDQRHHPRQSRWQSPYYTSYAGAEKIDDFTCVLKLTGVSPAVMEYLAMVTPIWPEGLSRENWRRCLAMLRSATGPTKITKVDALRIDMERYDGYSPQPKGRLPSDISRSRSARAQPS